MQHSFDAMGRLASVSMNQASLAIFDYGTGLGGPLAIHYANGVDAAVKYDPRRGNQTDLSLGMSQPGESASKPIASISERFGLDGSPRQRQRSFGGSSPLTDVFWVDGAGRLTNENLKVPNVALQSGDLDNTSVQSSITTGTSWRIYGLDPVANWFERTNGTGPGLNMSVDAVHRVTSVNSVAPTYDGADNTISVPDTTPESYTFNSFKQIVKASAGGVSVQYDYDAVGRRFKETDASGDHYIVWDGDQIVARGDDATDGTYYTVEVPGEGLDRHIAQVESLGQGARRFYHQGADGSMLGVTDDNVNLTGVDNAWTAAARAARGAGGATDWEVLQIQQNAGWWSRIQFFNNGQAVPHPFQ